MTLSWLEIDQRWPGASVLWDRDVAGEGWDPVLVERDGVLWATDAAVDKRLPTCTGRIGCNCRAWDGECWVSHGAWAHLRLAKQLTGPAWSTDQAWEREVLGQWATPQNVWLNPENYRKLVDIYRHAPHRWRTIRQVLGRNTPR